MKSQILLIISAAYLLTACTPNQAEIEELEIQEMREARIAQKLNKNLPPNPCRYISGITEAPPEKQVVLTFDDGPSKGNNEFLLNLLDQHGIKATFFMVGNKAQQAPDQVASTLNHGHLIANHSWDHANFHKLSLGRQLYQINESDSLFADFLGPFKLARYPYGNSTCFSNEEFHQRGYKIVGWHVDSCDWGFNSTGEVSDKDAEICDVAAKNRKNFVGHVLDSIRAVNGGIVLLHENQKNTVRKVPEIIETLLDEGYVFKNLDDPQFAAYLE